MADHTKGEIKIVRGSGPPLSTIDEEEIVPGQILYVINPRPYADRDALTARVIGIDLTRRTVRLQLSTGKEILYSATSDRFHAEGHYWLFATAELCLQNLVNLAQQAVKDCERAADEKITALEKAKAALVVAKAWKPSE